MVVGLYHGRSKFRLFLYAHCFDFFKLHCFFQLAGALGAQPGLSAKSLIIVLRFLLWHNQTYNWPYHSFANESRTQTLVIG